MDAIPMGFARQMLIALHHVPAIARMANVILVPIVPRHAPKLAMMRAIVRLHPAPKSVWISAMKILHVRIPVPKPVREPAMRI